MKNRSEAPGAVTEFGWRPSEGHAVVKRDADGLLSGRRRLKKAKEEPCARGARHTRHTRPLACAISFGALLISAFTGERRKDFLSFQINVELPDCRQPLLLRWSLICLKRSPTRKGDFIAAKCEKDNGENVTKRMRQTLIVVSQPGTKSIHT